MASNSKPVPLPSDPGPLTREDRNAIYGALMSHGGVRAIEETLRHELQASGFLDDLRTYTNHLLRTGQATSMAELQAAVFEKVREHASPAEARNGANGAANGNNGVANGAASANAHREPEDYNLAVPRRAVVEGVKTVRRELAKVAEITNEENK